jgi:hypothetical protein
MWTIRRLLYFARRAALLGGALSLTACSMSTRLSLLPTIDTTRAPGFEATASVAVGLASASDRALFTSFSLGGGFRKSTAVEPVIPVSLGVEYVRLGVEPRDLGFRVGVYEHNRLSLSGTAAGLGAATQVALLPTVWTSGEATRPSRSYLALGPVLDVAVLAVPESPPLGRFGLGASLEWFNIGSLP